MSPARPARPAAAIAAVAPFVAACGLVAVDAPRDPVDSALARIVARDLAGSETLVCAARRGDSPFPLTIEGIFAPVDGLPFERELALLTLDASGRQVREATRQADEATVTITGILVERVDPAAYEAAYRAEVAATGQAVDRELLIQELRIIGEGRIELVVRVVREDGAWRICEPEPTP